MALKLLELHVDPKLILWITSFLTNRTQVVSFQKSLSDSRNTSTGSPQGTVLSPILFTLYTNDCTGSDLSPLIKYSDDTALEDLSNSDAVYFQQVNRFCTWCKDNFLDLNVTKTKEMTIDFRRNPAPLPDLYIDGKKVERVNEYKYLGTILDNKLSFDSNTTAIEKKCRPRIYCLQKLRSLNVNRSILSSFYRCFIESVLTFGFICWYGGLSVKNKGVLGRVTKVCAKVTGERQKTLTELYECRVLQKARVIMRESSHVLAHHYEILPSGRRLRVPKFNLKRTKCSFIPKSIELLNKCSK